MGLCIGKIKRFCGKVLRFAAISTILVNILMLVIGNSLRAHAAIWVVTDPVNDTGRSVLINEVLIQAPGGREWVEVYNNSTSVIDLSGWYIRDSQGADPDINLSGTIAPSQVKAFAYLGAGSIFPDNGIDDIFLFDNLGDEIDRVQYDSQGPFNNLTINNASGQNIGNGGPYKSFGRVTDGSTTWQVFELPTAGLPNNTLTSQNNVWADNDDITCDLNAPCYPSIDRAISEAAASGATIRVGPGTYSENLTIGKSLTLIADSVDYTLSGSGSGTGITINSGGVTVKNARIQNFENAISVNSPTGTITINNNTFINNSLAINNSSTSAIDAGNNNWQTGNLADIEKLINHKIDNSSLGLVDYRVIVTALGIESYQSLTALNLAAGQNVTDSVGNLTFKATTGSGGATIVAGLVSGTPIEGQNTVAATFDDYYAVDAATGASINWPIRLEIPYAENQLPFGKITRENQFIGLFFYNLFLNKWQYYDDLTGVPAADCASKTGVDTDLNLVWAQACHLTTFIASADTLNPTIPQDFKPGTHITSLDHVKISWKQSIDDLRLIKYVIKWKHEETGEEKSAEVGPGTNEYTITGLLREGKYYVTITAHDDGDNTASSSLDLVIDRTGPAAPTLRLGGIGQGTVLLSWEKVLDAVNYIIWYGTEPRNYDFAAKVGNIDSFQVRGLPGGVFYFALTALDQIGNQSAFSNEVNTGPVIGAPGVATGTPAEGFVPAEEVLGEEERVEEESEMEKEKPIISKILKILIGGLAILGLVAIIILRLRI